MLIGVDGNEANVREKVGVSVYTLHLLSYFQKHATKQIRFVVFLRSAPRKELPDETEFFSYKIVHISFLWSQIFLPLELIGRLFTDPIDVFFSPAHYAPRFCPCPTVVTIHDVAYIHYPGEFLKRDLFQLTHWTRYSIKNASKIISVSKTTKKDIMSQYKVPESKIEVIYNGFEKNTSSKAHSLSSLSKRYRFSPPYVLYVGTLQPRKNIVTLIKSFAFFNKKHPEYSLVIVGKKGWLFDEIFKEARDPYVNNKIIFTGYVSDEELAILYKNANTFVLPSLYEGFGLPLLEAMSFGTPVISSFSSSLPEIGSEACLYFDPQDPTDLLDKLELLTGSGELQKKLVAEGKKRVASFSWDTSAKETLQVLTSIPTKHEK